MKKFECASSVGKAAGNILTSKVAPSVRTNLDVRIIQCC